MSAGDQAPSHSAAAACAGDEGCVTCGDIALPLTVVHSSGADARCRDGRGREELVATELVGPVVPGDRILVHAGVAIERLDPAGPGTPGSGTAGSQDTPCGNERPR
jgi:hydrogenase maturation factor